MNIFVIGGCHVENYGIQAHLGFVQQWATHLKQTRSEPVNIICRSMIKLQHLPDLVLHCHEELAQTDLIVLQLGHFELSWRKRFRELLPSSGQVPVSRTEKHMFHVPESLKFADESIPISRQDQLKNNLKASFLTLFQHTRGPLPFLNQFACDLKTAFDVFTHHHNKVVVLTPFPTLNEVDHWLRRASLPIIKQAAVQAEFTVVNTSKVVPRQKAYFLADGIHLNGLGHLLIALSLSELPSLQVAPQSRQSICPTAIKQSKTA